MPKAQNVKAQHGSAGKRVETMAESRRDDTSLATYPNASFSSNSMPDFRTKTLNSPSNDRTR